MVSYKYYEDLNFDIADGAIIIDLGADIDGDRHSVLINCLDGELLFELEFNELEGFGEQITFDRPFALNFDKVRRIRLNAGVDNTAYKVIGGPLLSNLDTGNTRYLDYELDEATVNQRPRPGTFVGARIENANVDGSGTPVELDIVANTNKSFIVKKVVFTMVDTGINFSKFAGIGGGLTNGIELKTKEGGLAERDLTPIGIKTNSGFYEAGMSVILEQSTTDILVLGFEFNNVNTSLILSDSRNDYLRLIVNDNLTSISSFKVVAQGYEVDE